MVGRLCITLRISRIAEQMEDQAGGEILRSEGNVTLVCVFFKVQLSLVVVLNCSLK